MHVEVRPGESLARDLAALVQMLASLPVPGGAMLAVSPGRDADAAALVDLHRRCRDRGWPCSIDIVLDADADPAAALGRQPTSLRPLLELSREVRLHGVPVRWRVPLLPSLVFRLEAIFSLAGDERLDAVLVHAAHGGDAAPGTPLDAEHRRFVRDFIAWRLLGEERHLISDGRAAFYQRLHDELGAAAAPTQHEPREVVAVIEHDGHAWRLRHDERPALSAALRTRDSAMRGAGRAAGPVPPPTFGETARVVGEGLRALAQWARHALGRRPRPAPPRPQALRRVLVIGAYGGDHIGDTAILGGVLLRVHARHGTERAILMSQRPDHSARLVAMLDVPVQVTVREYQQSAVTSLLAEVDAVVFAGGPLMDLPKQLVKHLYTVALARRAGKPFLVEGIGAGPFVRRVSAWTARLLVRMADRITVRTANDAQQPLVRGLRPEIGHDPAFDYLDTRGPVLTHVAAADAAWIARLLHDTQGRPRVGINLRPLRPDYTAAPAGTDPAAYTRFVEARFEERLAEAMRQFHKACPTAPCFIFFPMNAIQFGLSDLRSAYRLKRLLRADVDVRIWEGDPSIDGVLALLRQVDVAITMRFHATIFALSQRRPVIGIDYRPGTRDKVAALLADAGSSDTCTRIDEMTTAWLLDRLMTFAGPRLAGGGPSGRDTGERKLLPVLQHAST